MPGDHAHANVLARDLVEENGKMLLQLLDARRQLDRAAETIGRLKVDLAEERHIRASLEHALERIVEGLDDA